MEFAVTAAFLLSVAASTRKTDARPILSALGMSNNHARGVDREIPGNVGKSPPSLRTSM
jgi:hypothetical protein